MNDMSPVIVPKSDQLNSDSLIGGPITITVREVAIRPGTEQPVSIFFDGDDGNPWKPCKSMSRLMVAVWGADSKKYTGRGLTLYRDPTVKWGGMEVGGIRISHMSHMDAPMTMALTATKGSKKPYTVHPLATDKPDAAEKWTTAFIGKLVNMLDADEVAAWEAEKTAKIAELADKRPDLHKRVVDALAKTRAELIGVNQTQSEQTPATQDSSIESGTAPAQDNNEAAEQKDGAAASTQYDPPSPPLWKQLVGRAGAATTLAQVASVQEEFDAREAEVPFADQGAVQDSINAASERLKGE